MTTDLDVRIRDEGTIVVFEPVSDAARAWFDEHVQSEPWQWLGRAIAVDHRPARDLLDGLEAEGFTLGR